MDYYSDKLDKLSLQAAYEDTDYQIIDPEIHFNCGQINAKLDQYLQTIGKRSWVFLSAANPGSIIKTDKVNRWQNINLEIDLSNLNSSYTYASGKAKSGQWPKEESFVVFDFPLEKAQALAKKFGQNAILVGRVGQKAKLVWL